MDDFGASVYLAVMVNLSLMCVDLFTVFDQSCELHGSFTDRE